MTSLCLAFKETVKLFCRVTAHCIFPPAMYERFSVSASLPEYSIVVFYGNYSVCSGIIVVLISLMDNDVE